MAEQPPRGGTAHDSEHHSTQDRDDNTVTLTGRVSASPVERPLPSGDVLLTFRMVVGRTRTSMTAKSRQTSDWVDCAAWGARARRTVARWGSGDRVTVHGSLRRRFYRTPTGPSTRLEVEVLGGRRVTRAGR